MEGPKAALTASKDFEGGHYKSTPQHGIRAFGRVYSAWAYGQTVRHHLVLFISIVLMSAHYKWFRENQHLYGGTYSDLNTFLHEIWEGRYLESWDANDMLALLNTWQTGDVAKIHGDPDLQSALGRIKAKGLIMPCKTFWAARG